MTTSSVSLVGQMSDISLGGCYVEMKSPLPSGTEMEVILIVERLCISAKGRICSSREGFGIGITFAKLNHRNQKNLIELVEWVSQALPGGLNQGADHADSSGDTPVQQEKRPFDIIKSLKAHLKRLTQKD